MKDEAVAKGKNLLQNPSLLWDFVLLFHPFAVGFFFHASDFWACFSFVLQNGDWALTGLVIGLGIFVFLSALTWVIFAGSKHLMKFRHWVGIIESLLSFFVVLILAVSHPMLQAFRFMGSGLFIPSLVLCLLFSLTSYIHQCYDDYQAFRSGDMSVRLPQKAKDKLRGDGTSEKRAATTYLIISAILLWGLVIFFLSYLYDAAFDGAFETDSFDGLLIGFLAEGAFSSFAFLGTYFWGLWRIFRPKDGSLALLPGILVLLILIGAFRSPFKISEGAKDSTYYAYYSREKWAHASPNLRKYMLPDFEKQVDLVGKDYATVIYYLDAPNRQEKEDDGSYSLEYDIGQIWDGTRYYSVTLSKANIVSECRYTFDD